MLRVRYVGRLFDNTYRVNVHNHELWEVVYYTSGSGIVEIDGKQVQFEQNDVFVIPPNVWHTDYSDLGFQNYHYTFSDFNFNAVSYIKFKDSENKEFLRILEQLYTEYHLRRRNWENIVDSLYDVLYQYIQSFSESAQCNKYVAKAINDIISNISNTDFDLQKIVDDIPLSEDYFRKLFFKYTRMTPLKFLINKRVLFAKQLLLSQKTSKLFIKEIAWKAGYSDYYYFSRVFKKETGLSPRLWVKENTSL